MPGTCDAAFIRTGWMAKSRTVSRSSCGRAGFERKAHAPSRYDVTTTLSATGCESIATGAQCAARGADDPLSRAALDGLKSEAAAQMEWFVAASARAVAALAALAPAASEVEAPDVGALLADAIKNARPSLEPRGNKSAAAEDAAAKGSITQAGLEGLLSGLLSGK